MKKTLLALLITIMALGSILGGCSKPAETSMDSNERVTVSIGFPQADETWKEDDYYRYITDKLNIDIEFKTLSGDSWGEKSRIWISSGDMPDMTFATTMMDEYKQYAEQGAVKELPKDLEEKYPNLGFSLAMTGIANELKEAGNGNYYGLVIPLDHYQSYLPEFRAAYKEGKDLSEMMVEPEYLYLDSYCFSYRKDWAKQLGIEADYIMEYDDFIDMVLKFKEADLGGVGADNTVGIAVDFTEAPNFFVTAYNSSYKEFYKDETGKYVSGLLDDSTTEGIKAYADAYRKGVLAPDFYTYRSTDLDPLFCTGRSGVIFPKGGDKNFYTKFEKANPGLKAEDCIASCWVLSPDGKVHGREDGNVYASYYFNPDISDVKLDRLLKLADYISSEEGGPQVRYGVPEKDYKVEDGKYVSLLETGTVLKDIYPSYEFFRFFLNPQFPALGSRDGYAKEQFDNMMDAKRQQPLSTLKYDPVRDAYAAEDYIKFNATYDVNNMFAEIITSEGDIEEIWLKKRAEFEATAKSVADNMNKALLK